MYAAAKKLLLEDGKICIVRSPNGNDARNLIIYLKEVAKETNYMIRYIDEIGQSREWTYQIRNTMEQEGALMLCAFLGQKILAMATLCRISPYRKASHRATLSLSVLKEVWRCGIGKQLMKELIGYAKEMGYYQIELEVACDNVKAITLYLSFGFQIYGRRTNAYYIAEDEFLDEYLMYKELQSKGGKNDSRHCTKDIS